MLENIINQEGITFTDDAKDFIVSISNSSIRTLINYLEKIDLMTSKTFTLTDVKKLCTNICLFTESGQRTDALVKTVSNHKVSLFTVTAWSLEVVNVSFLHEENMLYASPTSTKYLK